IGNTGSSGSDSGSAPTVTMNAGGADIYGTADGFHGLFSSAEGDVTVIARVASMTNTHPWATAGVMIRASLSPDAPNAAMLLTADIVCVFQARTTAGGDTASTSGGYFNAPYWVKLTRTGNTFAGFISADGLTWTQVGSQDIAMSGTIYVGVAGSSHNVGAQTTIAFDHLTVTTSSAPPPPPPASWSQQAWSASGSSVTVAASGDAIVLAGASADLWENSDGGTFAYHASTGDALIEARVDSLTRADSYSKAGLMFRATAPNPYSANACVVVTPEHGIIFQARQTDGSATIAVREVGGVQAPVWLRLGRAGNDFIAAYSLDEGVTWTTLGTVTVTMPATVSVGVVATSHNSSASSTASFSHIQN
ncbi:MAG: hypothetical protein JWQ62_2028, partial [Lacunisphaera sp.]|nr:hypothetical protein [Lacunisphaera sp.]